MVPPLLGTRPSTTGSRFTPNSDIQRPAVYKERTQLNVTTAHPDVLNIARMIENLAVPVHNALDHINRELAANGYPRQTPGASDDTSKAPKPEYDKVTGKLLEPVSLYPTERAAYYRQHLLNIRDQIHLEIKALASIYYDCNDTCTDIQGIRITTTTEESRCTANPGLAGYNLPLTEGGWHDPLCKAKPRSAAEYSMCDACRKRCERWRDRQEQKPLTDERHIDHDSIVTYTDGVAHTRPAA